MPLGFSRVYVQLDEPFSFAAWMRGLATGRSFVTTGPMIFAKADGQWPSTNALPSSPSKKHQLECTVLSEQPLEVIELIVNGVVMQRFEPQNAKANSGSFDSKVSTEFSPKTTSWLAWRCFEKRANERFRFAHTAPWHFEVPGQPLRPRRAETEWLAANIKAEIARSQGIAPESLITDYRRALEIYEQLARTAE